MNNPNSLFADTPHAAKEDLLKEYQQNLKENPADYTTMFKYGALLCEMHKFQEGAKILEKLVSKNPNEALVYTFLGKAYMHMGQYDKAVSIFKLGLQRHPFHTIMMKEMANSLFHRGDASNAIETIKLAIEKEPYNPEFYVTLASIHLRAMQYETAHDVLTKAIEIIPNDAGLLNTLGAVYIRIGKYEEASKYFLQSARIAPTYAEPLLNLAGCFEHMNQSGMSLKFYDEVLKLEPDNVMALCAKSSLMCNLGMAQEALPAYKKGLDILKKNKTRKNHEYVIHLSNYIFFMHYSPENTKKAIFKELVEWQEQLCSNIIEKKRNSFKNTPNPDKKLRIGYISGGFLVHPVGQMIIAALENLKKDQFETYIYSDVPAPKQDYMTNKFREISDEFTDITSMQNTDIIDLMREHEIDILIEMTGYSEGGHRLSIAATRAAPVQVKWVGGLFNTTGLPQMDWIIADKIEIPEEDEKWYTESVYRMPDDYIVYNPPFYAPDITSLPAEKNGYITFGNLNNLAKTNSYSIMLWSQILHAVPNSKLLLKTKRMDTEYAQDHVRQAFASHGISDRRLIFEGGEKHRAFMDVYNRIDIALDPHPYKGGLTTCEALWMGVPVVTLPGKTFAGKHAETHLTTAGLEDWIAASDDEYVTIAQKWAMDIPALAELRAGLRDKIAASPLVDGPTFAKNFEIAMRHMWKDWCNLKQKETK